MSKVFQFFHHLKRFPHLNQAQLTYKVYIFLLLQNLLGVICWKYSQFYSWFKVLLAYCAWYNFTMYFMFYEVANNKSWLIPLLKRICPKNLKNDKAWHVNHCRYPECKLKDFKLDYLWFKWKQTFPNEAINKSLWWKIVSNFELEDGEKVLLGWENGFFIMLKLHKFSGKIKLLKILG